jgi:hypothetical protein
MFKPGDRVRFRLGSMPWGFHRKAIGTVIRVFAQPANGVRVDVLWAEAGRPLPR